MIQRTIYPLQCVFTGWLRHFNPQTEHEAQTPKLGMTQLSSPHSDAKTTSVFFNLEQVTIESTIIGFETFVDTSFTTLEGES